MRINECRKKVLYISIFFFLIFVLIQFIPNILDFFIRDDATKWSAVSELSDGKAILTLEIKEQSKSILTLIGAVGELLVGIITFLYFVISDKKENDRTIYKKGSMVIYNSFDCDSICEDIKKAINDKNSSLITVDCNGWSTPNIINLKTKIYSYLTNYNTEVLIPPEFQFESLNQIIAEANLKTKNDNEIDNVIIICDDESANKYEMELIAEEKIKNDLKKIKIIYIKG